MILQVKINKFLCYAQNNCMIDLIDECAADLHNLGYELTENGKYSLSIGKIDVESDAKSEKLGFDKGSYMIFNCPLLHRLGADCLDYVSSEVGKGLKKLFRKHKLTKRSRVLIVGLGNPQILADALGNKTLSYIDLDVFRRASRVFKFEPNIFLNTGINSFDLIHMLAIWLDVDAVVAIDSLGTDSISRLTCSIQINDAGMTPASAVNNLGNKICSASLGVPCISIGIPTMLINQKTTKKDIILTPKDIRIELEDLAILLARALDFIF